MAKQKYEITAFTKGIIGSPSETDIPEDAASYSVNIDPNAEDGVLRGIKKDTVLNGILCLLSTSTWAAVDLIYFLLSFQLGGSSGNLLKSIIVLLPLQFGEP